MRWTTVLQSLAFHASVRRAGPPPADNIGGHGYKQPAGRRCDYASAGSIADTAMSTIGFESPPDIRFGRTGTLPAIRRRPALDGLLGGFNEAAERTSVQASKKVGQAPCGEF